MRHTPYNGLRRDVPGGGAVSSENNSMRKPLIIAVVATIMLIIAGAGLALSYGVGSFETSWGEEIANNDWYVYVNGETLTPDDLDNIARMKRLESLTLIDCNVAECRLSRLTFASKKLRDIDLSGTEGLWDYSFLAGCELDRLNLTNCTTFDDLALLDYDELRDLNIEGTAVTDLSPLAGTDIGSLCFAHTAVSDVSPLAKMEELWDVDGSYTQVSSLDVLAQRDYLYGLCFDGCPIEQMSTSFAATGLSRLSLANTPVSDLSGLSECDELDELNLSGCVNMQSMEWLRRGNYETLTSLRLNGCPLSKEDVSWVASCTSLETLGLSGIELGNLDFCKGLTELQMLEVVGCGLTDVSGISGCTQLELMLLGYNRIADVSVLPINEEEWTTVILDLSHNGLESVAKMPKGEYRLIMLHGNDPDIGRTVPAGVSSYDVVVPWFAGIDDSRLAKYDNFSYLYLLDCPLDQRGHVTNALGSYRTSYATEEELWQLLLDDDLGYHHYTDFSAYVDYARAQQAEAGDQ